MSPYYNAAGQRFDLPELPLEPPERPIRAAQPWASKSQAPGILDEKTAPSAANTESGKAEKVLTGSVSASNDTRD